MNNVLITGVNGFIGSHVAEEFCRQGVNVCGLVRQNSNLSNINGLSIKLKYGDIEELDTLKDSFKGYDCVIHIAAYVKDWGEYGKFYRTNVEGTLNVLKACCINGIRNVILTSSNSVYGEEDFEGIKDENSPHNSHYPYFMDRVFPCKLNYYRDTKALAKKAAIEYAEKKGINLTVIEPVWVYGEREFNTGFYEYLSAAKSGIPFLPGTKTNKFHVVYARDLARAYYLAFVSRLQGVHSFIIGNEEVEYMDRIYSLFCSCADIRNPKNIPKLLAYPAAFSMELLYTVLRLNSTPLLTRGRINMFYDNIRYSTTKAREQLGFSNVYSLNEGIERTVHWYKGQGLI